jgi:hypothetical protein
MSFSIRRVVTAHDADGNAIVGMDSIIEAGPGVMTPSTANAGIWATDSTPAAIDDDRDPAATRMSLEPPRNGSIFRVIEFPPSTAPRMHRTDTIDYVIVMDGEIDMLLRDSEEHLKSGDVMVQRGTYHGWANRGDAPCRIAFILIDARQGEMPQ